MAVSIGGQVMPYVAEGDLSSSQYRAVMPGTAPDQVAVSDGTATIGVLQNKPTDGQAAEVQVDGTSWVIAGVGGLTTGKVSVAADGSFVAAGSGTTVVGTVRVAAAEGKIGSVLLQIQHEPAI